ncbi:DinB family protein [Membranihabitans marinus]|uniref:DinB family protein n=1 Tax=Membranihabitans marinus TaxID=1227546 RepID=UPI001F281884|nr:DinB family protein [Membranihabitans marinus]
MNFKYPYVITRPNIADYPSHLKDYILKSKGKDGFEALLLSAEAVTQQLSELSVEELSNRYGKDKWSLQEVFMHLIDNERMFQNRGFRIARNESKSLSGYDQDRYVKSYPKIVRTRESLIEEYETVRKSTFLLFVSLTGDMMTKKGRIGRNVIDLSAIPFIIAGHDWHHLEVIKRKYLK